MNSPEVSILVPVYNGARYLAETIASLLAQSFRNFELLAIDDGSTDNSVEVLRSFQDPRLRILRKPNSGLCNTLNYGIEQARAPWIARSDQDDISFSMRLERQMQAMEADPEAVAAFSYNSKLGGKHKWSNADKLTMQAGLVRPYVPLEDGCLLGSTMLARTDTLRTLGGFRAEYYPTDDWDIECRLALAGKVLVLCEPLVAYRFQGGANTYRVFSEMQVKVRWTGDSYKRRRQGLPELSFEEYLKQEPTTAGFRMKQYFSESAKWYMRTAGQAYLDGRYFAAAGRFFAAFLFDPADVFRRFYLFSKGSFRTAS